MDSESSDDEDYVPNKKEIEASEKEYEKQNGINEIDENNI